MKIASLMAKPNALRTKEENETKVLHTIDQMMKQGNHKDLINKIASTVTLKRGEVAEFKSLLNAYLQIH